MNSQNKKKLTILLAILGVVLVAALVAVAIIVIPKHADNNKTGEDISPAPATETQSETTINETPESTETEVPTSIPSTDSPETESPEALVELPKPDNPSEAEEYYWSQAKVYSEVDAKESKDVKTEKTAIEYFDERGFNQYPIEFEYSIDGTVGETKNASDTSNEKHPIYTTLYMTESGEIWVLYLVNGTIIANPLTFNYQSNLPGPLYLTETGMLTSYDNDSNKFFDIVPLESVAIVKKVQTINAELLNGLTAEELKKYE